MKEKYYDLPLNCERLTKKDMALGECDLKKSIAKNIVLIITSKFNEHRYNTRYGCEIWDSDFELISDTNQWKEKVRKSISETLNLNERRLAHINVDAQLNEEELKLKQKNIVTVKKRLEIKIDSTIKKTGESFNFRIKLYISPLSLD